MISGLNKAQWISVVKNAIIAGLAAFATSLSVSQDITKPALVSAVVAGFTAIIKVIEKLFTPVG